MCDVLHYNYMCCPMYVSHCRVLRDVDDKPQVTQHRTCDARNVLSQLGQTSSFWFQPVLLAPLPPLLTACANCVSC